MHYYYNVKPTSLKTMILINLLNGILREDQEEEQNPTTHYWLIVITRIYTRVQILYLVQQQMFPHLALLLVRVVPVLVL